MHCLSKSHFVVLEYTLGFTFVRTLFISLYTACVANIFYKSGIPILTNGLKLQLQVQSQKGKRLLETIYFSLVMGTPKSHQG